MEWLLNIPLEEHLRICAKHQRQQQQRRPSAPSVANIQTLLEIRQSNDEEAAIEALTECIWTM